MWKFYGFHITGNQYKEKLKVVSQITRPEIHMWKQGINSYTISLCHFSSGTMGSYNINKGVKGISY